MLLFVKRWRLGDRRGVLQIIHQLTNTVIKIQFITRIKLLHVSAPECHTL